MLRTLLAKDLRRARRNPLPWVIQLAIPLVITGIIGAIFSPSTNSGGLGEIRIAYVDEDGSWLSHTLKQSLGPEDRALKMKIEDVSRDEALRLIDANKLAAVVIVPKGFMQGFVDLQPVAIELVKNPANTIHPTVVEEYLATLTTALNALSRTVGPDFSFWRKEIESHDEFELLTTLLLVAGTADRLKSVADYLRPPLVWVRHVTPELAAGAAAEKSSRPGFNLFQFILVGMAAMFLLFIADNAVRDLYHELSGRTLARYRTVRVGLTEFISAKVGFAVAVVLIGAVILLGGGGALFQVSWQRVPSVAVMVLAYAVFAAGLMALMAAIAGNETRAGMFNNVLAMSLAIAGGCMFPLENIAFWKQHVAPWMPTYWFAGTTRDLQLSSGDVVWIDDAIKLAVLGGLAVVAAAAIFRRRLEQGVRA